MTLPNAIEAAVVFITMIGAVRALAAARVREALGGKRAIQEAAKVVSGPHQVSRWSM